MTRMSALLITVMLTGCGSLAVTGFQKDEASGTKPGKLNFYVLTNTIGDADRGQDPILDGVLKDAPGLLGALNGNCSRVRAQVAPIPAAIIPAVGKLLFDLFIESRVRALDDLRKAAQRSYSQTVTLSGQFLQSAECLLLARSSEETGKVGLVALLKLNHNGIDKAPWQKAFTATPVYVAARNAVAVTQSGDSTAPPYIGVSIGIVTKAVGDQQSGVPELVVTGEGSVSVPRVKIGPLSEPVCTSATTCGTSGLIAFAPGNSVASITVSVTETGNVGIDFDQASAELKAIKEALGPALKEGLKESIK